MMTLADLHRAVQTTLASKRIGQPVFVRCTLQSLDKAETIVPKLTRVAAVVHEWLGQPLDRVYAVGTVESGQVSLTLQFRQGATALISFARGQPRGSGVDLLVLGNHGAIYHDAGSADLWDEPAMLEGAPADPTIQAVIERALQSGKPELAGEKAKP